MKNVNTANIKTNPNDLFEYWVELTKPLHHCTDTEAAILLAFLRKRHMYVQQVKDESIADRLLFSTETRKEIMKETECKMGSFQNYLTSMRNKGIITENRINKKLIPNFEEGSKNFKLIFNFIVNG
jgi:hypothetical protein